MGEASRKLRILHTMLIEDALSTALRWAFCSSIYPSARSSDMVFLES